MTAIEDHRAKRLSFQLPLLLLVLAFTSIPTDMRPVTSAVIAEVVDTSLDLPDVLVNVIGFVPVGIVLSARGPRAAVALAALLSVFAETMQLFSVARSPSIIDVITNTFGAALGVAICARWCVRPLSILVTRPLALVAATLALIYVVIGVRIMPDDVNAAVAAYVSSYSQQQNVRGATSPGRLEARWTFHDVAGNAARDESGNGRSAVLVNDPMIIDGIRGRAVSLNGTNQWVNVPDSVGLRLIGSMTVAAWIKPIAFPRDDAAIVSTLAGLGYEFNATADQGFRTIAFKLSNASGRLMARYGRTRLQPDRWYHVAGVYDAEARTIDVFVNGRRDSGCLVGQVTNRQLWSHSDVFIGRRGGERGFQFSGAIDDIRIYSRAVREAELRTEVDGAGAKISDIADRTDNVACRELEPTHARIAGPVVLFGMLAAFATVGLTSGVRHRAAIIGVSFLSGFALIPAISPMVPPWYVWMLPVLTLVSGLSIAASIER